MRSLTFLRRSSAALALLSGAWPSIAGAQPYAAFGNLWTDDCQFETDANLILHEYPNAHISIAEVLRAYDNGKGLNLYSGLDYLEYHGFDGHTATWTPVTTKAQIIYAAMHGGVWATMFNGSHAVGILAANEKTLVTVDDGIVQHQTWANWDWFAGRTFQFYAALSWNSPNTETLYFVGDAETDTMTPQTEPTGTVTPIEANGMVEDGWTFLGWNTEADGSGTMYQSGQGWTFTQGATLYAQWDEN